MILISYELSQFWALRHFNTFCNKEKTHTHKICLKFIIPQNAIIFYFYFVENASIDLLLIRFREFHDLSIRICDYYSTFLELVSRRKKTNNKFTVVLVEFDHVIALSCRAECAMYAHKLKEIQTI